MSRIPIRSLAALANAWATPTMERPVYWRTLIGRDSWALLLITKGKPGELPTPPDQVPVRLSPDWARRTGRDLAPEELLYERITQHLKAHDHTETEVDVTRAASIATTAAIDMLTEYGIDVAALERPE